MVLLPFGDMRSPDFGPYSVKHGHQSYWACASCGFAHEDDYIVEDVSWPGTSILDVIEEVGHLLQTLSAEFKKSERSLKTKQSNIDFVTQSIGEVEKVLGVNYNILQEFVAEASVQINKFND